MQGPAADFVFPPTDVAFTTFSLEQIPAAARDTLANIVSRVRLGTIHLEPVPENYPWSYRGILGRLYSWRMDYLRGFATAMRELPLRSVHEQVLRSAHNAIMFPSIYLLKR